MDDNKFGVPAGWYPDPLGLPQLRWWDAQAWTEHTSEARAPIIIQPSTVLGYADDDINAFEEELPSRREKRERERRESSTSFDEVSFDTRIDTDSDRDRGELSAQPLLAMTLRELEPPLTDSMEDATPQPKRAGEHANVFTMPAESLFSAFLEDVPQAEPEQAPVREMKRTRTYTGAVWTIAVMPFLQLIVNVWLVQVAELASNTPLIVTVWVAPYLLVIGLAAYDRLVLQIWGHTHPARAFWAVLTGAAYLLVRGLRTFRVTGKGFAPLAVLAIAGASVLVGILIWPGVLVSTFPSAFAAQAAGSIEADAASLGAEISVRCPAPPDTVGESETCIATKPTGETDSILVSLERENGWITWRVQDWGAWILFAKM